MAKLKNQPEYADAKEKGDWVGAYEMASRLLKPERIEQIKSNLAPVKKVHIIPIQQKDTGIGNVIPVGMAYVLAEHIGPRFSKACIGMKRKPI